ncbi:MAG TPA: DUF4835 family protein [Chitinophagales bacterium]|nr:DUF4835 family protein [Chitinophagales bacterium]
MNNSTIKNNGNNAASWPVAILLVFATMFAHAQEFKCNVTVNAQKIGGVDPSVFQNMQTSLNEFMNTRAFTNDVFAPEERIECSMFVFIESSPSQDVYNAKITIQSSRPVFNSSYNSPMFNYIDNDCQIGYVQNQSLDFSVNQYNSNLTSILGFYAYVMLGMDYESFGKGGGAKYFAIAEQIMNNVPTNAPDAKGWRPFDGTRNRYWLINNMQSSKYDAFKKALYDYHFAGLDNFYDKPVLARQNIMNALDKLEQISKENPNGILLSVFFQAKSDELVGIFSGADFSEKVKAVGYLRQIDPSNSTKYEKLLRG